MVAHRRIWLIDYRTKSKLTIARLHKAKSFNKSDWPGRWPAGRQGFPSGKFPDGNFLRAGPRTARLSPSAKTHRLLRASNPICPSYLKLKPPISGGFSFKAPTIGCLQNGKLGTYEDRNE